MKAYLLEKSARMGRALTDKQAEQICAYHDILIEVNKSMNLTRVPDTMAEAADRNYLDSLAPWLMTDWLEKAETLLDVGAGAGFPGIPLSIALPDTHVVLLDSLRKRVDFLNDVIGQLGLNAEAIHFRAEEAAKRPELRESFDIVTARAVAALPTLCELTLPFAKVGGALIAYHGPKADEELPQAKEAIRILGGGKSTALKVPMPERDWDHRLVRINKERPTPKAYPRKSGDPGRKPLGVK